ncbi:MAG: hypothetical protein Q7T82_10715 [Armatimonadota bacterium]|nr:hypothetical protein [Armatimonadota bacterium]
MDEITSFDDALAAVRKVPHWRVVISPEAFKKDRIPSLHRCRELVESCRVKSYPRIYESGKDDQGDDWAGHYWASSFGGYSGDIECWRLYRSGQFVQRCSLPQYEDATVRRAIKDIGVPQGPNPIGLVSWLKSLYAATQVFEFAARLAGKVVFDDAASVTIQMIGVKNHMLWDPKFTMEEFHIAPKDDLEYKLTQRTEDVGAKSADLALDAAVHLFGVFGWHISSVELAPKQHEFLHNLFCDL